jgi:hypothetical protein
MMLFSCLGMGLMVAMLLLLPETRGRSLGAADAAVAAN